MGKMVPGIMSHFSASKKERGLLEIGPELTLNDISPILHPTKNKMPFFFPPKLTFS